MPLISFKTNLILINTRTMSEICSMLLIKTSFWCFVAYYEKISHIVLCFLCWLWTSKYWLGKTYHWRPRPLVWTFVKYWLNHQSLIADEVLFRVVYKGSYQQIHTASTPSKTLPSFLHIKNFPKISSKEVNPLVPGVH